MADQRPPLTLALTWDGDLRFTARSGTLSMEIDGNSKAAVSPVQALAVALAGCMASDVVHILMKGRQPVQALRVAFSGVRAEEDPRRFVHIGLEFVIEGAVPAAAAERAVALSHEKYCSVWHSLRQDIELTITLAVGGEVIHV